jgi:uncharacterized protein
MPPCWTCCSSWTRRRRASSRSTPCPWTWRAASWDQFDARHGGFGKAPKFPHPTSLERLLRHWAGSLHDGEGDTRALEMALFSLDRMALGGMYDQLGGGFCRYSTDEQWMIPHFEKMLYDNGPLLSLYSEAHAATGSPLYRTGVRGDRRLGDARDAGPGGWLLFQPRCRFRGRGRPLLRLGPRGGAGRCWTRTTTPCSRAASASTARPISRAAGIPHVYVDYAEQAQETGIDPELERRIDTAREKLFQSRERRVRPGRDEKILTSWNGLMIKGMASAARHLGRPEYLDSAERALDFIRARLWQDGRLLATCKDGRAHLPAYLDDYVFLIDGILELLAARWRDGDLDFALQLAEVVLAISRTRAAASSSPPTTTRP